MQATGFRKLPPRRTYFALRPSLTCATIRAFCSYHGRPKIQQDDPTSTGAARTDAGRARSQASISRQALSAIEAGSYLPNVAIAVRLARVIGVTVEELFGDADEDHEQRIDARWKKSPVATANRKRVILARVGGKLVALAQPSACLTLPVRKGLRIFPPDDPTIWETGYRMGARLRCAMGQELGQTGTNRSSPVPHIRRAHWHSFWLGPRTNVVERRLALRWLPPIPVALSTPEELVPAIRQVS
jgi:DNA-binding XRE family transcriptional regulator